MPKGYMICYNGETIEFEITRPDGWYAAKCLQYPIFTQAEDLVDLGYNISEAVSLHFEDYGKS